MDIVKSYCTILRRIIYRITIFVFLLWTSTEYNCRCVFTYVCTLVCLFLCVCLRDIDVRWKWVAERDSLFCWSKKRYIQKLACLVYELVIHIVLAQWSVFKHGWKSWFWIDFSEVVLHYEDCQKLFLPALHYSVSYKNKVYAVNIYASISASWVCEKMTKFFLVLRKKRGSDFDPNSSHWWYHFLNQIIK